MTYLIRDELPSFSNVSCSSSCQSNEDLNCNAISAAQCLAGASTEENSISNVATTLPLSFALRTTIGTVAPLRYVKGAARCNIQISKDKTEPTTARSFLQGTRISITYSMAAFEGPVFSINGCALVSWGRAFQFRVVSEIQYTL